MNTNKYLKYLPETVKRPIRSSLIYNFIHRLQSRRRYLQRNANGLPDTLNMTIELTNKCNLKCKMCPHPKMVDLKVKDMDLKIFKKIVDEIAQFGSKNITITPVGLGEPLMYPDLPEALEYIKIKSPNSSIHINTNATLLDEDNAKMLCKLLGERDILLLSINADNREVYEWLMGRDKFDQVVNNIKDFLKIREKIGNGPKVTIQLLEVRKSAYDFENFKKFWNPLIGQNDKIYFRPLLNWGGTVDIKDIQIREKGDRYPCPSLWTGGFVILNDGNVYSCCEAQSTREKSDLLLGNIQEKSIAEIYSEKRLKDFQKKHLKGQWGEISDCSNCDFWSFNENIWFKIGNRWY